MSNPYDELAKVITGRAKAQKVPALVWATVKDVDWDAKEMTATGLTDGLDYYGVLLGIGGRYVKPAPGSKVLLGVIEGHAAHTVLVFAEEKEEEIITAGNFTIKISNNEILINGNAYGGLVISSEVADDLNEIKRDLNTLKTVFNSWIITPSDGGAALKTAAQTWASQNLNMTNATELENEHVKHG